MADPPGCVKFEMTCVENRGLSPITLAAMKFNNKVIAIGMVYNYRDPGYSFNNPSTGNPFNGPGLYNSGNFILFEK